MQDEHRPGPPANWAGNVVFSAGDVHRPRSVTALQALVARSRRVRALGTGHSFSPIADTPGTLVATADLPPLVEIDSERATVLTGGGVRYGDLARRLHAAGYALANLGSLPHISVAGACATASHGSGDANGGLATAVSGLELVTAAGDLVTVSREADGDRFRGAVVGLGSLGIVTALTLDLVPAFEVRQHVYEGLPAAELPAHFGEIFASAYSVSVFTDWQGDRHRQLWLKQRTLDPAPAAPGRGWHGARPATGPVNPVPGMDPVNCTAQMGVPGPWHERLPHFRPDFVPSSGEELQSEYLLPRRATRPALAALASLAGRLAPALQICEIRTVAPDDLWLSPSYQRDTVALHFTWVRDEAAVAPAIGAVESELAPLGARPHWGKLTTVAPAGVSGQYPRWEDFAALLAEFDPAGKFRNDYIDRFFPPGT
ncbi:MAG: FAD-binding protein [Actinobacteria bacterium]|nr:FAD-binding protein [Actinomycetota bacterium]